MLNLLYYMRGEIKWLEGQVDEDTPVRSPYDGQIDQNSPVRSPYDSGVWSDNSISPSFC